MHPTPDTTLTGTVKDAFDGKPSIRPSKPLKAFSYGMAAFSLIGIFATAKKVVQVVGKLK